MSQNQSAPDPNTPPTNGLERALAAQAKRTPPGACETCLGVGAVYVTRAGAWYEVPCADCRREQRERA